MIETIERRICDVCRKEVKAFAGSLELRYVETGCLGAYPTEIVQEDICIDCCRKLDNAISGVLREVYQSAREEV